MNNNTKIIIWVIVIVVILGGIWFYYYYNKNNTDTPNKTSEIVEPVKEDTSAGSYFKELASFLPKDLKGEVTYNGSLEHNHIINFDDVNVTENTLSYKGKIVAEAESTKEDLNFEEQYTVDGDTLKLSILNKSRLFFQSMVKDKYLLQGPVQVGNAWSQEVDIDGKKYIAKYEIKSIDKVNEKETVVVEMTIDGLKGYDNDKLVETTTLTEGKGLTKFETTILTGKGAERVPLDFQYSLFTNKM